MGEADGSNICNLTAKHGLYYLPVPTNGFDLSTLMDTGAIYSFVSLLVAQYLTGEVQNEDSLVVMLLKEKKIVINKVILLDLIIDNVIFAR